MSSDPQPDLDPAIYLKARRRKRIKRKPRFYQRRTLRNWAFGLILVAILGIIAVLVLSGSFKTPPEGPVVTNPNPE